MQPGTRVFLQSDVLDAIQDMVQNFASSTEFSLAEGYSSETANLCANPSFTSIQTEREIATIAKGELVHRCLFVKKSTTNDSIKVKIN